MTTNEQLATTINPPHAPRGTYTAVKTDETEIMNAGEMVPRGDAVYDIQCDGGEWNSGYTEAGAIAYLRGMGGDVEIHNPAIARWH